MPIFATSLNARERKVFDIVDPQLSGLASIVVLKEEGGDRVRLDVVSPHHFERAAAVQAQACGEAAQPFRVLST